MATFSFKPDTFFSVTKNPSGRDYTVTVEGFITTDFTDNVGDVLMPRGVVQATDEPATGDREGSVKESRLFYITFVGKDVHGITRPTVLILNHPTDIPKTFPVTLMNTSVSPEQLNEDLRDRVDPSGRDDFRVKVLVDRFSGRSSSALTISPIVHHDIPALS